MAKSAEAFRSIGEVAKLVGVAPHVLRYWETQFTLLRPMKRGDGRRYYRPADVALVAGICELLRDQGLSIRGARKQLSDDKGQSVRAMGSARLAGQVLPHPQPETPDPETMTMVAPAPALASDWLASLGDLGRRLRRIGPRDERWQAAKPAAIALGQMMIRLS
ncbi:MAG: MerR family transcriptional regulator [Paracoccus sp. (in: a-proteobacteria)]|nr:MerR family transcriptional regulator [Paracoccus sp. (in: a-proteobacteria)]